MNHPRVATRLVALAAVTLFGVGACASEPRPGQAGVGGLAPVSAAGGEPTTNTPSSPARPSGPAPTSTSHSPVTPTTTPPKPTPTRGTTSQPSGCQQGDQQRVVETYLARLGGFGAVTVDGRQSAADCAAIKKFQQRYGIRPAEGRAGSTTADVARRLASTDTAKCQAGTGTTFCVDLTLQTVWVMRGGTVVMAPTVTRTGMAGHATVSGWYTINARNLKEWSNPYEVWLPYWQHFSQGMGFHETTTYLHDKSIGSHGCVNLLPADARRAWQLGTIGARVHLFGRRPGT